MSSLRNAVQRRNHRERDQPTERSKWGLLEKRKDYKLRASDHKAKAAKLKALSQKASERNEDEFYFGMMSSQSKGGVKISKRGVENSGGAVGAMGMDVVKLLKTQDVGYLRTVVQKTRRERERLREEVVREETGVKTEVGRGRTVFAEDGEDVLARPVGGKVDDEGEGVDWPDEEEDGASEDGKEVAPEEKRKRHGLEVKRRKLDALEEQEEKLTAALREVEHQRAKMNGTVGGVNKNGVKFKARQRKR